MPCFKGLHRIPMIWSLLLLLIWLGLLSHTDALITRFSRPSTLSVTSLSSSNNGGVLASVMDAVMNSPLRIPMVKAARNTMVKSVEEAGADWQGIYNSISEAANWNKEVSDVIAERPKLITPEYYKRRFHAYDDGNLCLQAALEQEVAGKAVGIRNFPSYKMAGEDQLRGRYDKQIIKLGGTVLPFGGDGLFVDMGCGTGTSTRRLAKLFPQAKKVIGFDLSPHMIAVGRVLQREVSSGRLNWLEEIAADERMELQYGDIADTQLPDASASFVNLCFVLHELPYEAAKSIIAEAQRILRPGGVLAIMEMDPTAPGYKKARSQALLFSVFKSTEPYLDSYFDLTAPQLGDILMNNGFGSVQLTAATGRHMAIVARKNGFVDMRPSDEQRLMIDEHLPQLQSIKTRTK